MFSLNTYRGILEQEWNSPLINKRGIIIAKDKVITKHKGTLWK